MAGLVDTMKEGKGSQLTNYDLLVLLFVGLLSLLFFIFFPYFSVHSPNFSEKPRFLNIQWHSVIGLLTKRAIKFCGATYQELHLLASFTIYISIMI